MRRRLATWMTIALAARTAVSPMRRRRSGVTAAPSLTRIQRHRRAMPQYAVGHLDRVAAIETAVAGLGTLAVAGSVSAAAPAGHGGRWLLDPGNITIESTSASLGMTQICSSLSA